MGLKRPGSPESARDAHVVTARIVFDTIYTCTAAMFSVYKDILYLPTGLCSCLRGGLRGLRRGLQGLRLVHLLHHEQLHAALAVPDACDHTQHSNQQAAANKCTTYHGHGGQAVVL